MCQSVFYHIRNVNSIRKTLSHNSAASIIHALITSRPDNGNALLHNINDNLLTKLQLAQNAAARILIKTQNYDHITLVLKELYGCLFVGKLCRTWKCVNDKAPSYLQELIVPYSPACQLRSSNIFLLTVPRTISSYGDCSFSACAPKLWMTHYDFKNDCILFSYCLIMFPHFMTVLCHYLCIYVLCVTASSRRSF